MTDPTIRERLREQRRHEHSRLISGFVTTLIEHSYPEQRIKDYGNDIVRLHEALLDELDTLERRVRAAEGVIAALVESWDDQGLQTSDPRMRFIFDEARSLITSQDKA